MQVHTFALDCTTTNSVNSSRLDLLELVLAGLILIIVARRMPGFHTLRVLGRLGQGQQLLLQFGGYIHRRQMSTVGSHTRFGWVRTRA